MRRRELLRLLAISGVAAGCGPSLRDEPPTAAGSRLPSDASADPTPSSGPTSATSPSPSPTPGTVATAAPTETAPTTPAADAPDAPVDGSGTEQAAEGVPEPDPDPDPSDAPGEGGGTEQPATGARRVTAIDRLSVPLRQPRLGGTAHTITGLALHHTASGTTKASSTPDRFAGIVKSHQDDQGWIDIAYHWGVDLAGNIYQLRDEGTAGDTNTNYDPAGWFLVVCDANFENVAPSQAMLDAVADVFAYGAAKHGVSPSTLRGHQDLAATLCPGAKLQSQVSTVQSMVESRLAAGGVDLEVIQDRDRVTAIRNG